MEPYKIIEPGSLDLDAVELKVGGLLGCSEKELQEGRKFVLLDENRDRLGLPLPEVQNGTRSRLYSILVGPEDTDEGRHRNIPAAHGRRDSYIVGGGQIQLNEKKDAVMSGKSIDYGIEPLSIRSKLAELLTGPLRTVIGSDDVSVRLITTADESMYHEKMKPHWYAYLQVVELAKKYFGEHSAKFKFMIQEFNLGQARIAKEYANAYLQD